MVVLKRETQRRVSYNIYIVIFCWWLRTGFKTAILDSVRSINQLSFIYHYGNSVESLALNLLKSHCEYLSKRDGAYLKTIGTGSFPQIRTQFVIVCIKIVVPILLHDHFSKKPIDIVTHWRLKWKNVDERQSKLFIKGWITRLNSLKLNRLKAQFQLLNSDCFDNSPCIHIRSI